VAEFNKVADTEYTSWSELQFSPSAPLRGEIALWGDYAKTLPPSAWILDFPELRYRDFLLKKYGSLAKAWQAYGVDLTSRGGDGLQTPEKYVDELNFKQHKPAILWYFLTDNYVQVSRFLLLQGRAGFNTLILVFLSVLTSLVINPMAAYALSRFRLSYTSKILLFLLATAAFPAEVTQIPQFLMMKNLGMLNSFWALVLPGVANGFFIFLLKGFFDSLPKEIYEAAILDGANEFDMFTRIAVPLAAPILAVIALGAFTYAYSAYQFAIVVCPDPKMWTLMVYLQQFMNSNPYNLVMASFALASIPTLVVFLMAQRVILRGIVIPTMH
jgi:multiple sugar transport system permease protein